ncbi:hypothetical protein QUA83_09455 [Microcoleus sp. K1-B1]|uniref:hypothetical protein n=1 Tax=Microcoleus sp. K1-B6 TaxID=2818787 RepID=UPI002FD856D8
MSRFTRIDVSVADFPLLPTVVTPTADSSGGFAAAEINFQRGRNGPTLPIKPLKQLLL